ncbi:hypothetical protein GGR56DRAFT_668663 [Xylariaceae sp. FL0804]|nr:hypothetical protein GGR56DRAFT_668663 [Xylariaceae sp. FL0804]
MSKPDPKPSSPAANITTNTTNTTNTTAHPGPPVTRRRRVWFEIDEPPPHLRPAGSWLPLLQLLRGDDDDDGAGMRRRRSSTTTTTTTWVQIAMAAVCSVALVAALDQRRQGGLSGGRLGVVCLILAAHWLLLLLFSGMRNWTRALARFNLSSRRSAAE